MCLSQEPEVDSMKLVNIQSSAEEVEEGEREGSPLVFPPQWGKQSYLRVLSTVFPVRSHDKSLGPLV